MAVSFTIERAEDPDTNNLTAYDIGAAFTPNANSLLILCLSAADSASLFDVSTVAGGGLTWVPIPATGGDTDNATVFLDVTAYYALVGASPASTLVTVTYSEAITGCVGWIGEFAGHNTTTPIKQFVSALIPTGTKTQSLTNPPDADSLVVFMSGTIRNSLGLTGWDASADGWTPDCDAAHGTPANGLFVVHKANDQTVTYTGTNGDHWGIMFEIDAAATATQQFILVNTLGAWV